ncbi:MAG TPA: hypothetical protein VM324_16535 [Egibacteraceae bacterium]|nr:hypothetical protein [Egibacteraceae bacterium]
MVTETVVVADARAWAAWIRGVRADIAEGMRDGHINPALGAPEHVHRTLLDVLATIDGLPHDRDVAEAELPDAERLHALTGHLAGRQRWFDQLVEWGLSRHARPQAAIRFQKQLGSVRTGEQRA